MKFIPTIILFIAIITKPLCSAEISLKDTLYFGTINAPHTKLHKEANLILTEAFKKLGYYFKLSHLPGKRSLLWLSMDRLDGDAFRIKSLLDNREFVNMIRVDEPLISINQSVWSVKDIKVDGWESLSNYTLVYQRGTKLLDNKRDHFKDYYEVNSMEQVFNLIKIGRFDLTITSEETGKLHLKNYNIEDSGIRVMKPPIVDLELYPYMAKKHNGLAIKLAKVLRDMKNSGEFFRLKSGVE